MKDLGIIFLGLLFVFLVCWIFSEIVSYVYIFFSRLWQKNRLRREERRKLMEQYQGEADQKLREQIRWEEIQLREQERRQEEREEEQIREQERRKFFEKIRQEERRKLDNQ